MTDAPSTESPSAEAERLLRDMQADFDRANEFARPTLVAATAFAMVLASKLPAEVKIDLVSAILMMHAEKIRVAVLGKLLEMQQKIDAPMEAVVAISALQCEPLAQKAALRCANLMEALKP